MRTYRRAFGVIALGFAVLASGCSDASSPTEPQVVEPSEGLLDGVFSLLRGQEVQVLHRTTPLARDEVVSQVIGPWGGTIRLPQAGLTVRFPAYAVRTPTRITVTAPAGDLVGYHFAPHGLRFRRDVKVVQNLWKTDAGLLERLLGTRLSAAYFDGELEPTVNALEILPLRLLDGLGLGTFSVEHFSGYVIATD
jgi:hypothetical protein